MSQGDPLYSPEIIPTLLGKIGALTVRQEMLTAEAQALAALLDGVREAAKEGNHATVCDLLGIDAKEQ